MNKGRTKKKINGTNSPSYLEACPSGYLIVGAEMEKPGGVKSPPQS